MNSSVEQMQLMKKNGFDPRLFRVIKDTKEVTTIEHKKLTDRKFELKKDFLLNHECKECGFKGDVLTKNRKVICPECNTANDYWLEGENPPTSHR